MNYRLAVESAAQMFLDATPEELAAPVPSTPQWSANDVLAHLVAGARSNVSGVREPPSREQSLADVLLVRELGTEAMVAELLRTAPQVRFEPGLPSVHWDMVCHLADVREAWGRCELDQVMWRPVLHEALAFCAHGRRLHCRVVVDGFTWGAGASVTFASGYRLFRALFGRLPLDQLAAFGDPRQLQSAVLLGSAAA